MKDYKGDLVNFWFVVYTDREGKEPIALFEFEGHAQEFSQKWGSCGYYKLLKEPAVTYVDGKGWFRGEVDGEKIPN